MKRVITLLTISILPCLVYGQQWTGSSGLTNILYRNGNISVGSSGMFRVSIGSAPEPSPMWSRSYIGFNLRKEDAGNWTFLNDGVENDGVVIYTSKNALNFSLKTSTGATSGTITQNQIAQNTLMRLNSDGKLIIGSLGGSSPTFYSFPGTYRLYVQNGILTEKVKVALNNTAQWSDYVFEKNYNLLPISEIEEFIESNKHLPGVPSANEVVENGLDLAEMDATLLKKIEELTLYIIQQQKEIDELKIQLKQPNR